MKLYIKNMVSKACKMLVKEELKKLNLHYLFVDLVEVEIMETMTHEQHDQLNLSLHNWGLELIDDKKSLLIEKIKASIIEMVHYLEEQPKIHFSDYLSEKLGHNYTYMSNLFSEVMGITIEHYLIAQRIERVKELIAYDELSLSEIAFKMNYSSVAHLSNQFKSLTGLTVSEFKKLKHKPLIELENVGMVLETHGLDF